MAPNKHIGQHFIIPSTCNHPQPGGILATACPGITPGTARTTCTRPLTINKLPETVTRLSIKAVTTFTSTLSLQTGRGSLNQNPPPQSTSVVRLQKIPSGSIHKNSSENRAKLSLFCVDSVSSAIRNDLSIIFTSRLKVDAKCVYQQCS